MTKIDVFILGLGPAGASAAAEAARCGCSVLAVDRRREAGRPVQCAGFVSALVGLDMVRVASTVKQSIDAMNTYVEDDPPDVQPDFPGLMLDRGAFDALLVASAKRAGAECRFGMNVRRISRTGEIQLADGSMVRAEVIIGADGPCSRAGAAIGRLNADLLETRQITVPLLRPHRATDIFLSADIPGGYGWLFPKGDLANLGAGVDRQHRSRLKSIVTSLHRTLAEQGRVTGEVIETTGGLVPVGGMLAPWGMLRNVPVLLAGDAAGLNHPITGAGIAAAVYSGRLAGAAATDWIAGDRQAGPQYQEELESVFKTTLDRAVRRRRELGRMLARKARPAKHALRRGWIAYPEYWAHGR